MLDLVALAGGRWRVTLDPSADQDTLKAERQWLYRLEGRRGFVSIHGPETLAAFADRPSVARRLVAVDGVRVHQRGDREVRVLLAPDAALLDSVATLLQCRKRRRLSDSHRQRLLVAGEGHRFCGSKAAEMGTP